MPSSLKKFSILFPFHIRETTKKAGGSDPVPLWVNDKQTAYLEMTLAISRTLLL